VTGGITLAVADGACFAMSDLRDQCHNGPAVAGQYWIAMSWTVACFCGTVYEAPPDRCPTCDAHVPDVHANGRIDSTPGRPSAMPRGVDANSIVVGSLEDELSELIASAAPRDDRRRYPPVDAGTPRVR
jgi:hypothetical protein